MAYYIMKGQIITVFLSIAHLSAISFPGKVRDYVGGQKGELQVYQLNQGKSLVLESKSKSIQRNFIIFLKDSKYHLNLVSRPKYSNKDIEIYPGEKCNFFSLLKKTAHYQLFECPKSLFFVNKRKRPVKINNFMVQDQSYLSKGPPVYLDGKMIYYQGYPL